MIESLEEACKVSVTTSTYKSFSDKWGPEEAIPRCIQAIQACGSHTGDCMHRFMKRVRCWALSVDLG